jgi:hypothetical protein
MDILVPIVFVLIFLGLCLFVVASSWVALKKVARDGWRSLLPNLSFSAWNRFWFIPRDPTVLGLIRILCGAITTYTVFAYTFMLQDFMGKDAWYDLPLRLKVVRTRPNVISPLSGRDYAPAVPTTPEEKDYCDAYKLKWGLLPPAPFPTSQDEVEYLDRFKAHYNYDLRFFGLQTPRNEEDEKLQYIDDYMKHPANVMRRPPPAYPASEKEKDAIFDYMAKHGGFDPRLAYTVGHPAWSIWLHVTDPAAMNVIHGLVVLVAFLFTIGLCTRLTSALTWITSLWYIHRDPVLLFGVDTMMVILLLYLMIGPSGAALSVDRLIARWWSKAKPRVVNRWRALYGRPALPAAAIAPAAYSPTPVASVSCNFAIRMLQVHLCFIYLASGLSKLQGPAWWNGTAVWGTLANFEFAPMAFEVGHVQVYNDFLRLLGGHQLLLDGFLTGACLFTLTFEIGYAFLIWRTRTRWLFLAGAMILHGFIGLLMGLKTFSLIMLVMNMGFLRREEVAKVLNLFTSATPVSPKEPKEPALKHEPLPALAGADRGAVAIQVRK